MTETNAGYGQLGPSDTASDYNVRRSQIKQFVGTLATNRIVRVVAVYDAGGQSVSADGTGVVGPTGYVDVEILVNQVDGAGQATQHGVIHGVPFGRGQGGANGIICDPQVGDIGVMACSDRDISSVKANRDRANPGSYRRMDPADGMYVGPLLNGAPDQYVRFVKDGMEWTDKNGNTMVTTPNGVKVTDKFGNVVDTTEDGIKLTDASGSTFEMKGGNIDITTGSLNLNGSLNVTGPAVINGEVTGGPSGVGLTTHTHAQDPDSDNDTEVETHPPTPGS